MWIGGVRVLIMDEEKRLLMVCQHHEGKDLWMVPGGGIEKGENSIEAARREVFEETGLEAEIGDLIWHVEQTGPEVGQRFVNFFLGKIIGGDLKLGSDPEFDSDHQVLCDVKFMSREEIEKLEFIYPEYLRDELWEELLEKDNRKSVFKIRE